MKDAETVVRAGSKKLVQASQGLSQPDSPGFLPFNQDENAVFLHGLLLIDVVAAKDLPDMESWLAKLVDKKDVTDPFVDIR